jgi:flagellar motor protein MotB
MKINKATFDLMPAAFQAAFTVNPANADEYDNGEENAPGLKTALEAEKAAKVKAAQERDALLAGREGELAKARAEALKEAREKGDFAAIEKDYQKQLADARKEAKDAKEAADRTAIESATESVVSSLLPSFVSAKAGRAILAGMVKVELVDGKPVTRFLDAAGSPTALDAEGFKKNLLADPDLKGILVASKGSGGGATQPTGGGGATSGERPKDAANAPAADMVAFLESKGIGAEA